MFVFLHVVQNSSTDAYLFCLCLLISLLIDYTTDAEYANKMNSSNLIFWLCITTKLLMFIITINYNNK